MSVSAEERLREELEALAERVTPSPDAYRHAQADWRRRERRRRIRMLALVIVIIALADIIGLWALNHARSGSPVVFDGPAPVQLERTAPAPRTVTAPASAPSARARPGS